MPAFKDNLESTKDTEILEHWNLCVQLLGKHLHSGAGLINGLMTVLEKAFKLADGVVIEAAFRSWMVLMNNFSLSPHILNSSKRVKPSSAIRTGFLRLSNFGLFNNTKKEKILSFWSLFMGPVC